MNKVLLGRTTFISLLLCLLFTGVSYAADDDLDNDGYDENTEITLKGTIQDIVLPPGRGPVMLVIIYKNRPVRILTAPVWYLERNNIVFRIGMEIEVTGSKFFGRKGHLSLSARKIIFSAGGRAVEFRDRHCRPIWRGMR